MTSENNSFADELAIYNQLYEKFLKLFFDYDPIGISYVEDEYSPEVRTVLARLPQPKSAQDIAIILKEEFDYWFGSSNRNTAEDFLPLAEEIYESFTKLSFENLLPGEASSEFYVKLINQLEAQFADFNKQWVLFQSLTGLKKCPGILVSLIQDENSPAKTRLWAAKLLKRLGRDIDKEGVENIVALVADTSQDENLRILLANILHECKRTSRIEEKLVQLFASETSRQLRIELVKLFAPKFKSQAATILEQALAKDIDTELRLAILVKLADYKKPEMAELLIKEFSDSSGSENKLAIISGLANFPQETVIKFLIAELENQEEEVQVKIIEVLAEIATEQQILELFVRLAITNPLLEVRKEAIYKLGRMQDSKAITALIQAISDSELDIQEAAIYGLSGQDICLTEKFNPIILPFIAHENENIRFYAAEVLAKCKPQLILELLKSENSYTRVSAIRAVWQTKDIAAIEQLLKLSKRAKIEEDEQYILFKVLIDITENNPEILIYPVVFEGLSKLLDNGDILVRQTIAGNLHRLKGPEVFSEVVRQLKKETHPEVIMQLLRTLGLLQDEQALLYLKNLTGTTEWQTQTPRLLRYKANKAIRMAENRAHSESAIS